jgi:hypothetical protein
MSGTEARTTDAETTGTADTRDDASSAAERLGGPIEDEQSRYEQSRDEQGRDEQGRDTVSEAEADVGRRVDSTGGEGDQSPDPASAIETDVGRRVDSTGGEGDQGFDAASKAQTDADRQADTGPGPRATLIEPERAESYNSRWNELKGEFVDDPRGSVQGANQLVGEVLDELEELFRSQRADLEHGLDSEETTTEDLRQALGRYRSFFDRLLSF